MRHLGLLGAAALGLSSFALHAQDLAKPMAPETATPVPEAPPATPAAMTVAEKVSADWPRYDLGAKGHLTKAELSRWLGDLRAANNEPAPDAKWLDAAFAQTDADKDKKVSKDELVASLSASK